MSQNTGVIEGVCRFDADLYETEKGSIGRVKVDHKHTDWDKTSQFIVKGFGPFGEKVGELVEGQKVKIKYELVEERWEKDGEWKRETVLRVVDLKAEAVPEMAAAGDSFGDDSDIPF